MPFDLDANLTLEEYLNTLSDAERQVLDGFPLTVDEIIDLDRDQLKELKIGTGLTNEEQAKRSEIIEKVMYLRTYAVLQDDAKRHEWYYRNNGNGKKGNGNESEIRQITAVMNVSAAKQTEPCKNVMVPGMITSYSSSYKVVSKSEWKCCNLNCCSQGSEIYNPPLMTTKEKLDNTHGFGIMCSKCKNTAFTVDHVYRNARSIQLEDSDKNAEDSMDRLDVVLYDDAASNVTAGEIVEITGDIHIQRKSEGGYGKGAKKLFNVLHSNKIRYLNKEKVIITQNDIDIFYKHKRICEEAYQKEIEAAVL